MSDFSKYIAVLLVWGLAGGPLPPLLAQEGPVTTTSGARAVYSTTKRVSGMSFGSHPSPSPPRAAPFTFTAPSGVSPILSPTPLGTAIGGPFYQVHILGEISQPGTYRVPASTRLAEALEFAEGILARGSERRIELRRRGEKTKFIDFLSFKQDGNLDANPYLLDNDVIFVPLRKTEVLIVGAIRRPATYELSNEKTLADLITLTGGYSSGVAQDAPITIIRYSNDNKEVLTVRNDRESLQAFRLQNADAVIVPHLLTKDKEFDYNLPQLPGDSEIFYPSFEERIFVIGAVETPGPYPYSPYYSVREYLTLAGGLTKLAKHSRLTVVTSLGKIQKASTETSINPGDTIIVPERYMRPENWATLILGLSSAVLGITTTILTLTR